MKAGGGAKQNARLEQGMQVSMTTQRAATTTRHHHTEKLSGDTYQPLYSPRPAKREGRGRGKLPRKGKICSSKGCYCTTFKSEYASSEASGNPYAK